jgi:hypothetical protein
MKKEYPNKDEFLNDFFDHVFGEEEPDDEDREYFNHLAKFFDIEGSDNQNSGSTHRRQTSNSNSNSNSNKSVSPPRRRRQSSSNGASHSFSTTWFGNQ